MFNRNFVIRFLIPSILFGLYLYIGQQLFRFADISDTERILGLLWIAIIVFVPASLPLLFWFRTDRGAKKWHLHLHTVSHLCMGYFSYIFSIVMARDILGFLISLTEWQNFKYDKTEAGIILFLPFVLMLFGFLNVRLGPYIKKVKINLAKEDFKKLKIAQISDLHIGPHVTASRVKKIVSKANSLSADIIILTGDIIDYHPDVFRSEIEELKNLQAKHGVYFIAGNHEYFWSLEKTVGAIKNIGLKTLVNETAFIEFYGKRISISGAADPMARMFSLPIPDYKLLSEQSSGADLKIISCHQPMQADHVCEYDFHIQLSGHTHRGQFIPWSLMIRLFQKYAGGLYRVKNLWLYVNQGTGTWGPPDRFGTYCEITEIEIH